MKDYPPLIVTFEDQLYQPADTNSKLGASAYHLLQRCLWLVPDRMGRLSQSMLHGGFVGTRLLLWGRFLMDWLAACLFWDIFPNINGAMCWCPAYLDSPTVLVSGYGGFAWLLEMLQRQTLNPAKILLRDGRRIRPITNESGIGIGRGFS